MLIVTETYRRVRVSTVESILTNSTGSLIGGNLQGLIIDTSKMWVFFGGELAFRE